MFSWCQSALKAFVHCQYFQGTSAAAAAWLNFYFSVGVYFPFYQAMKRTTSELHSNKDHVNYEKTQTICWSETFLLSQHFYSMQRRLFLFYKKFLLLRKSELSLTGNDPHLASHGISRSFAKHLRKREREMLWRRWLRFLDSRLKYLMNEQVEVNWM